MGNNKVIGKLGEDKATEYLISNGYTILDRNVRFSKECEVDIIASLKSCLIAVEVKTRSTENFGTPFEAITQKKYSNIKKGLFYYMQTHKGYKSFRIDVIGIVLKPEIKITHLKNL